MPDESDMPHHLAAVQSLLEELFGHEWFEDARNQSHPAWKQWALCKQNIENQGRNQFDHPVVVLQVARMFMDTLNWVMLTGGDLQQPKLGPIEGLGDAATITKVLSTMRDPRQYEDVMIELHTATWHKSKGHLVTLQEKNGEHDIFVDLPGHRRQLQIECKRLTSISPNRLPAVVRKANLQLKAGKRGDSIGILLLDVSSILRSDEQRVQLLADVQATIRGDKNRSVNYAIVTWDVTRHIRESEQLSRFEFVRQRQILSHQTPAPSIKGDLPLYAGIGMEMVVQWDVPNQEPWTS